MEKGTGFSPHEEYKSYIFNERQLLLNQIEKVEDGDEFDLLKIFVDFLGPFSEDELINRDTAFVDNELSGTGLDMDEDVLTDHEKSLCSFPWYVAMTDAFMIFSITHEAYENEGGISPEHREEIEEVKQLRDVDEDEEEGVEMEEALLETWQAYQSLQLLTLIGHLRTAAQESWFEHMMYLEDAWDIKYSLKDEEEYMQTFDLFFEKLTKIPRDNN